MDGDGSFNWRMVWPISIGYKGENICVGDDPKPSINFKIWDKDIFSPDDFISEVSFAYTDLAKEAFENDASIKKYAKTNYVEVLPSKEE